MPTLFADKIYTATDLNRRSGELLQTAADHPITVVGSSEPVVMQSRNRAAAQELSGLWLRRLSALTEFLVTGTELPPELAWVADLRPDNRRDFAKDLLAQLNSKPLSSSDFEAADFHALDLIFYDWEATAEADASPELRDNLLTPLGPPRRPTKRAAAV